VIACPPGTIGEVFANIGGKQMYLWRAMDGEGEVLDVLLQKRRNKRALSFGWSSSS